MNNNKFNVVIDNNKYDAYVISNFNIFDDRYCVYAIDKGKEKKDVYCDKVVNNKLVKIENKEEINLTTMIVNDLIKVVNQKGGNNNE